MPKQASIASFFGAKAQTEKKKESRKSNAKNVVDEDQKPPTNDTEVKRIELVDTDDEDDRVKISGSNIGYVRTKRMGTDKTNSRVKRLKMLEESSDDEVGDFKHQKGARAKIEDGGDECDSGEEDSKHHVDNNVGEQQCEDEDEDDEESYEEPIVALKSKPKTGGDSKMNALSALGRKQKSSTPTNKKPNAVSNAASLLSCSKLIASDKSWKESTPVPYWILCKTLSEIEAITSRLEIQKNLTNLFRLCLLKNPDDLITLVYLASNSVAAAYECVELGIGDAILIKAVGEASGSNPNMIKQKYGTVGDLGLVAMTAKGSQKTLGFGIKPKKLMAKEVLSVFRQIATTTGSQSQKWKVDKIKGLLVRVQEPSESKYIIRGLQGKLRIGLAQSTVLISLAHSVLLSKEEDSNSTTKEKKAKCQGGEEVLSRDAKIVMNKKMAMESRLEAAVNIVKKAYSEVSSFDALVNAILKVPLSKLNIECTLRPGMPVEPMLAKPTKSIQEVLKRLNGKRFTCEFKYDGERAQVHMDPDGVTKVRI